jgi:hypothetical protein
MVLTNGVRLRRRSRYGLRALLVVVGLALLLPSTVVAGSPSVLVFDATDDFRVFPNQANPSGPWSYRQTKPDGRRPLLAGFSTDQFLVPGLETWHTELYDPGNSQIPMVGVNTSGSDQLAQGAIVWPAGTLQVHPGRRGTAVIIQWRSPKEGKVNVRASLIDRNVACGDGFRWSIRRVQKSPVASGLVPNGGSAAVFLAAIDVNRGTGIELRIGTGPGGTRCDSTEVNFRIVLTPS